jgi:hypothetical protein
VWGLGGKQSLTFLIRKTTSVVLPPAVRLASLKLRLTQLASRALVSANGSLEALMFRRAGPQATRIRAVVSGATLYAFGTRLLIPHVSLQHFVRSQLLSSDLTHPTDTVKTKTTSSCYMPDNGVTKEAIIKSPNNQNRGGVSVKLVAHRFMKYILISFQGYYCVVGTCRAKGDEYWDNTGRAGGP